MEIGLSKAGTGFEVGRGRMREGPLRAFRDIVLKKIDFSIGHLRQNWVVPPGKGAQQLT